MHEAPRAAAARALARALATSDIAAPHVIANLSSRSSQAPNIYNKVSCESATHGSRRRMLQPLDTSATAAGGVLIGEEAGAALVLCMVHSFGAASEI